MNAVELIKIKREGGTLSRDQLKDIVSAYVDESLPDYQMASFLMAIYFQGMADEEIFSLTQLSELGNVSTVPSHRLTKNGVTFSTRVPNGCL